MRVSIADRLLHSPIRVTPLVVRSGGHSLTQRRRVARRWQTCGFERRHRMAIDLIALLRKAFFIEEVHNGTEAIERAREKFSQATRTAGLSYEVVAPAISDESWVREGLLQPLVYYCESEGMPIPRCPGVFVSLFIGDRLYCITAAAVLKWAEQQLGTSVDELRASYGTHEAETILH
jgi:hypothetical protein